MNESWGKQFCSLCTLQPINFSDTESHVQVLPTGPEKCWRKDPWRVGPTRSPQTNTFIYIIPTASEGQHFAFLLFQNLEGS